MSNKKVYWKGYEELEQSPAFLSQRDHEFPAEVPVEALLADQNNGNAATASRRDFLKFLGFGVGAATLAACQTPVQKAIPYLVKPETITPGVPNYYASAYYDGSDFASLLVKTREGRPIKVKGNKNCPLTHGGTNPRIQASVLSLYDNKRLKTALMNGTPTSWQEIDMAVMSGLDAIAKENKKTVLLSNTVLSPSTRMAIEKLKGTYGNIEHIEYDAVSYRAIREAHKISHGSAIIPSYRFNKAHAIVSFAADFMNGWLLSTAYEHDYAVLRNPENGTMSRHFQFESVLSLAGSNADYRTMIRPSEIGKYLVALYNKVASSMGAGLLPVAEVSQIDDVNRAAEYLLANKGKSLVVCGLNDTDCQLVTNALNALLDSYGNTIDTTAPLNVYQGDDAAVLNLSERIKKGEVKGLLLYGVNPAYTLPSGVEFNSLLGGLSLSLSFSSHIDETNTTFICPDHNYLESWNDFEPITGLYAIQQPAINPLFDTRHAQESFLVWAGLGKRSDRYNVLWPDFIRTQWKSINDGNWNQSVQLGLFDSGTRSTESSYQGASVLNALSDSAKNINAQNASGWELMLYQKSGIGLGQDARNPILQEFPDPISRVTWDNYVTMAPSDMDDFGFNKKMGQEEYQHLLEVNVNGASISLPVLAQPGQTPNTIGIALGYGRTMGRNDQVVGENAFPLIQVLDKDSALVTYALDVNVQPAEGRYQLAGVQTHHTMMGREIIKETSLDEYNADTRSGNPVKTMHTNAKSIADEHGHASINKIDYWREFKMINHRWGMSIDLNACTGCGACVVSCHVENNVPVVGKDEVRRSRDMHWLRIDRYYTSDADPTTRYEPGNKQHRAKEIPSANPRVAFMPVMCQHCNHAPCETVCPVLATTHSTEGLNQMTYNRCVGTRYCANNCPYKVRRFNWFEYTDNPKFDFYMNDDLGKMVLNPDVTVRARGVMEKCSLCVQRIQAGKLAAKVESRMVKDGEIETACQEACPTNAIVFGDFNDSEGKMAERATNARGYYLLEEVGVKPNIVYQTKVRNLDEKYGHSVASAAHNDHHDSDADLNTHH
jgi:MoCo/4Fe-4S cofactor protein with predicted Tat translocation signal